MSSNRRDTSHRLGSIRGGSGIPILQGREDVKLGVGWIDRDWVKAAPMRRQFLVGMADGLGTLMVATL